MKSAAALAVMLIASLGTPALTLSQTFGAQSIYAGQTVQKLAPVLATVLAGDGNKVTKEGTGIVISTNGVVITSYSVVESARSLQVRIGDKLYDRVVLLAYDQDRDLAALRITATSLSLPNIRTYASVPGEQVYVLWQRGQREPSVALATVNRVDVFTRRNGKQQYTMLQFDAPVLSPVPGGALVDDAGRILGMVTANNGESGPHMAVPMSALLQFSEFSGRVFDSGAELRFDNDPIPPTPASLHNVQPAKLANYDRTYSVHSASILIERDLMLEALRNQRDFSALDFVLVENRDAAEVYVEVGYVPWTFDYTFKVIDQKTSVVIGAGKITAFNGYLAAPALAKKIAGQMNKWRAAAVATTTRKD